MGSEVGPTCDARVDEQRFSRNVDESYLDSDRVPQAPEKLDVSASNGSCSVANPLRREWELNLHPSGKLAAKTNDEVAARVSKSANLRR